MNITIGRRPMSVALSRVGPQGPPGPVGPSGGAALSRTADQALSGHRVVRATSATGANYADPSILEHRDTVLGITTGAAVSGAAVLVLSAGELAEPSWSWTPGLPIYVGNSGALTQVAPLSGWLLVVGVATSATSMVVRLHPPIVLT